MALSNAPFEVIVAKKGGKRVKNATFTPHFWERLATPVAMDAAGRVLIAPGVLVCGALAIKGKPSQDIVAERLVDVYEVLEPEAMRLLQFLPKPADMEV